MDNKQQNYSRTSNLKGNQTSEVTRKSSDTLFNKARRRDHSNSSRNDTTLRNSRQAFNNNNNLNSGGNNQKKNQGRWNNDKRPRPRGGGISNIGNFADEGLPGIYEYAGNGGGGAGEGGSNNPESGNGRNANRNGFGGGVFDATPNESDSGFNITSPGLANSTNFALQRHGKKFDYELNSVYAAGSKKQNLNHLLNFHYSPRDSDSSMHDINFFGRNSGHNYNGNGKMQRNNKNGRSQQHKYNKEQFLQANFQFVISNSAKPKFDGSPDSLIDWKLIEQINIQTTEEPQCPICLYPPIAAKISRCGHVYCWSCILHYLSLSDKAWRRCPICFEAIYRSDLKSCIILQQRHITVGEEITFRLMRRRKGSLFIEPFLNGVAGTAAYYPQMGKADNLQRFSKFLIAKRSDVQEIIERERKELLSSGEIDVEFDDEEAYADLVFVQQALSFCHDRMKEYGLLDAVPIQNKKKNENLPGEAEAEEETQKAQNEASSDKLETVLEVHVEDELQEHEEKEQGNASPTSPVHSPVPDISSEENSESASLADKDETPSTPTKSEKYHYFYQSDDGQNVYLHPLNIKMLQACYGSLETAPHMITANIVQREQFSMNEEHRRRLVCLSHLPLTCECSFVEVDLQPPFVTLEILQQFKEDILYRKKLRQRRQHEENKRERKINEFNDRQMGKLISSTANINISSPQEFPSCGFEERLPSLNLNDGSSASPGSSMPLPSPKASTSSYSNVTVFGESSSAPPPEAWPAMKAPKSSANYQELSTVWRRPEMPSTSKPAAVNKPVAAAPSTGALLSETESYSSDYDVRPMQTSLGDVLAEAMMTQKNNKQSKANKNLNLAAGSAGNSDGGAAGGSAPPPNASGTSGNGGSRKKNKRNKKAVPIFSTGMNHKGKD